MVTGMIFCHGCGKEIHSTAPTCPHCGAKQITRTHKEKSKTVAGVLAILLGGIGVHRFYLGQWWGIFYLLLCWTFVPAIVSFIEGIVFLLTSDESWDEKYNQGIPSKGGDRKSDSRAVFMLWLFIGVLMWIAGIGIIAAIAIPQFAAYRNRSSVEEIRIDLRNASTAQEAYFIMAGSSKLCAGCTPYKSCAPCTSKDLPGFHNNPKVTLVAEAGETEGVVLTATHENCGSRVWVLEYASREPTGPSDGCK